VRQVVALRELARDMPQGGWWTLKIQQDDSHGRWNLSLHPKCVDNAGAAGGSFDGFLKTMLDMMNMEDIEMLIQSLGSSVEDDGDPAKEEAMGYLRG
jgi:hypothetical protein